MNILVLSPDYPSKGRNVSVFVKQLVDEFARLGNNIEVVAPFSITRNKCLCKITEEYRVGEGKVRVIRPCYASVSNLTIKGWSMTAWLIRRAFAHGIRRTKLKHDFVYGHFWPSAYSGYRYAKNNGLPLFVATGESSITFRADNEDKTKFCNYINGVICVSSKNMKESIDLKLTTEDKCLISPNATNDSLFKMIDKTDCRTKLGIPLDAFVLIFVGAFNTRKGSKRVAQAISSITEGGEVLSIFLGAGKEDPICDGIIYKGSVPHEIIPDYLNAADVFILPTQHEGCSNAVIEAMACGLPVISSDLPFNWDVLNKSNSILIAPNNIKEISNAIVFLRDNKEKREELSRGALKQAKSLTIDNRACNILEFIKSKIIIKRYIMQKIKIGVIGLGYVGLPLARLFSTKYETVGFDMNQKRVDALMSGHDATLEVKDELLQEAIQKYGFVCTTDLEKIRDCNFYVVAVPTPVDENKAPDLRPLWGASETVGKVISKGDIVVYESTVYPGVTEDECIPVVEKISGLKFNVDFFAGYSPERINPGDKVHTVEFIKKITSGSTPEVADIVDNVYNSVLKNGTHKAPSMKVAEAAKVIENSERDIMIAFFNELSKIFTLMGIDTTDVVEAAGTKWNFIKMNPGLVGGHCISVDPYYLAQCAQRLGYNPEIILAGRRMNDGMGAYVVDQTIKHMLKKGIQVLHSNILIMGFTFKENCPDVRNTRVVDIYHALQEYNVNVTVYDPWANPAVVKHEYGIDIVNEMPKGKFDAAIVAVAHKQFRDNDVDWNNLLEKNHVIFDVKCILPREMVDGRL